MSTFNFPFDINIVSYLTLKECNNIKLLSKNSSIYIYHHHKDVQENASNIIKKFLKYTRDIFIISKNLDINLLYKIKYNSKFYKTFKFLTINLLYMNQYNVNYANSFIKGLDCSFKIDIIKKYLNVDFKKKYSKYDLNKILSIMTINDIFYVGF